MSVESGALAPLSVHSASPVLLTKNGPLGAFCIFDRPHSAAAVASEGSLKQPAPISRSICQFKVRE